MRTDKATAVLEGKYDCIKDEEQDTKKQAFVDYDQRTYENLSGLYANKIKEEDKKDDEK